MYWCNYINNYCSLAYCMGEACMYYPKKIESFNYECPDCHGRFASAVYKFIPTIPSIKNGTDSTAHYGYVCPFCGREMKGLN